jgi:hypothetical protein
MSKLAHLTFYFFHLARPQKSLPIPGLGQQRVLPLLTTKSLHGVYGVCGGQVYFYMHNTTRQSYQCTNWLGESWSCLGCHVLTK